MFYSRWLGFALALTAAPALAGYQVFTCPAPGHIRMQQSIDKNGHLQCRYSADMGSSQYQLSHIDRDTQKKACSAVPPVLTSVLFYQSGARQGVISCGYGAHGTARSSDQWAISNILKMHQRFPEHCLLVGGGHKKQQVVRDCQSQPEACHIYCQLP